MVVNSLVINLGISKEHVHDDDQSLTVPCVWREESAVALGIGKGFLAICLQSSEKMFK